MAADEKYPVVNREILMISVQVQLSQTQKAFSQFVGAFLKSTINFKCFEKKDYPHRFCISEITDSEYVVR